MRKEISILLCASSIWALTPAVQAKAISAQSPQSVVDAGTEAGSLGNDIVVTARRRAESLQDVPATVDVVTSEAIGKLNLQDFKEIQSIVPGLELGGGKNGFDATVSLRGVTVDPQSSAEPVAQFYVNDIVIDPNALFQAMYDLGQIEVLRGPQGTLRGRSAPAGAITVSTRRPDLSEVGGYIDMTGEDRGNINVNGAINLPLIRDVLAVRFAGLLDHDELDGVKSLNDGRAPFKKTHAGRASLTFEPTESLSIRLMYQYMRARNLSFPQVAGNGAPGPGPDNPLAPYLVDLTCAPPTFCTVFPSAPPSGYNGPVIAPGDRLAVSDAGSFGTQRFQLVTANIDWHFAGQKLSYAGGWQQHKYNNFGLQDTFNLYEGDFASTIPTNKRDMTHEIRLSSEDRIAGMFDYTVGVFYDRFHSRVRGNQPVLLPIANPFATIQLPFGGLVQPRFVDPTKLVTVVISLKPRNREFSYFGTVTAHVTERTELTVGARHIHTRRGFVGPFGVSGDGSSTCIDYPASLLVVPDSCFPNTANETPIVNNKWVWNASLSHRFSDRLLAYASAGTSFRPGPFSVVTIPLEWEGFASSADLRSHAPETSRGFEVGLKASLLDGRATINIAAYHQKYKNHIFLTPPIYSYNVPADSISTAAFTANADAIVKGVDIDASLLVTPEWSISGSFSWAKSNFDNDDVPCNDSNFDGVPDNGVPTPQGFADAGIIVARCLSNGAVSTAPRWTLSAQSEYARPVSPHADVFLRGLLTYYPENPYRSEGTVIDNYGMLNVYAGIRSPDGGWAVSVFAKNATGTSKLLSRGLEPAANPYFGTAGYRTITYTPRREVGLNVRYAFGSR
jgi:iron complex outermembrane receptor protein